MRSDGEDPVDVRVIGGYVAITRRLASLIDAQLDSTPVENLATKETDDRHDDH